MPNATCTADGCGKPLYLREMCRNHYNKSRRALAAPCSIVGCAAPAFGRGWCQMHYTRWSVHGDAAYEPPPRTSGPGVECSASDCDRDARAAGLCNKHYLRQWSTGTTDLETRTPEQRFLEKVDRRADDECWPFASVGSLSRGGYGIFMYEGKNWGAHVWAYSNFVGAIPAGYHIDHVRANGCTRRDCVNWVSHLEAVPPRINAYRGVNTKVSDELAVDLFYRWQAGESQVSLGLEIGVNSATLSRRFQRLRKEGLIPCGSPPGEPSRSLPDGAGSALPSSSGTGTAA